MLVKKKYTYAYFEIKNIYEFLNKLVTLEGISNEASQMIIKNIKTFEAKYQEIIKGIYNPNNDPEIKKYNEEIGTLMEKYADRDDQGNIVFVTTQDNKKYPKITEMAVEYQQECETLNTKYQKVLEMANNAGEYNNNYMNSKIEMEVDTWYGIHEFPDNVPPFLMFYFARDLI